MVDLTTFKQVTSQFPTGVAIVTCDNGNGGIAGLTASSFTSVSLAPPLVLFCPQYDSDSYPLLESQKRFAIHILEDSQADVAYAFARKGANKAQGIGYHLSKWGVPILDDYLAVMECNLYQNYRGGDHAIIVGEVINVDLMRPEERLPLAYCRGKMGNFTEVYELLNASKGHDLSGNSGQEPGVIPVKR